MAVRTRLTAGLVGVAGVVALAGCSTGDRLPAPGTNTTTAAPAVAGTVAPPSAESIEKRLDVAVSTRNFCALLAAMDSAPPASSDAAGTIVVYERLADAAKRARAFVPRDLVATWADVVRAIVDGLAALRRARGDRADPEVKAAFGRTASVDAAQVLDLYQHRSCP